MKQSKEFIQDEIYGERLLISVNADPRELQSNIRAARAILHSYSDVTITINAHTMSFGHKNPEYTIDGQLGDRKGIMGEKGICQRANTSRDYVGYRNAQSGYTIILKTKAAGTRPTALYKRNGCGA